MIFRVGKNNNFIKNINKNESSSIFNYNKNNVTYKLKIYKYNSFNKKTLIVDEIIVINKKINVCALRNVYMLIIYIFINIDFKK